MPFDDTWSEMGGGGGRGSENCEVLKNKQGGKIVRCLSREKKERKERKRLPWCTLVKNQIFSFNDTRLEPFINLFFLSFFLSFFFFNDRSTLDPIDNFS